MWICSKIAKARKEMGSGQTRLSAGDQKRGSEISIHELPITVCDKGTLQRTKVTQQMIAVDDDGHGVGVIAWR